jgi:hypothetical protein
MWIHELHAEAVVSSMFGYGWQGISVAKVMRAVDVRLLAAHGVNTGGCGDMYNKVSSSQNIFRHVIDNDPPWWIF